MNKHRDEVMLASKEMVLGYYQRPEAHDQEQTDENDQVETDQIETFITSDDTALQELISLVWLVKKIARSKHTLFHTKQPRFGINTINQSYFVQKVPLGLLVLKAINKGECLINFHFPIHHKNPYVVLFFEKVKDNELEPLAIDALSNRAFSDLAACDHVVNALNQFIEAIRQEIKTQSFKDKKGNYLRSSNKNYKSTLTYVENLFKQHNKMWIIRMDFGYNKSDKWPQASTLPQTSEPSEASIIYEQARKDRALLIKQFKKNGLFKHLVGYAIKMEYAHIKGCHLHAMFFFDGSISHNNSLAKMIGAIWKEEVTETRGLYHSCTRHKDQDTYKNSGVGYVEYDDLTAREEIRKGILYLTKADDYMSLAGQGKDKTFIKGSVSNKKTIR